MKCIIITPYEIAKIISYNKECYNLPVGQYRRILLEMARQRNSDEQGAKLNSPNIGQVELNQPENISRQAYASDGSIYSVNPQEVVVPHDMAEVISAFQTALNSKMAVTPRGGGTGLAGGALGSGLVMQFISGFGS